MFLAAVVLALFFLWLVGGHTFKVLISAVVQNKDTGQEERAAGVLMKRCVENLQYGERRHFASPVWQSRFGSVPVWAFCPQGGTVWLTLRSVTQVTRKRQ